MDWKEAVALAEGAEEPVAVSPEAILEAACRLEELEQGVGDWADLRSVIAGLLMALTLMIASHFL